MFRRQARWLFSLVVAVAWLESCGAMSIEPATPDEATVAPPPAPRLVRRDGGAGKSDDDRRPERPDSR